jgi:hypothetical protein
MDISLWVELTLFVILLGPSGFFSSIGTRLVSLGNTRLEQLRRDGNASLDGGERLLRQPPHTANTCLNRCVRVPLPLPVAERIPGYPATSNNPAFASFQSGFIAPFANPIIPLRRLVRLAANRVAMRVFARQSVRTGGEVPVKW